MEWYWAGGLMLGAVLGFMAIGFPVAFAFLAANVIGVMLFMGGPIGIDQLVANGATSILSFLLVAVPLFILMGELFFHSGLAARVFDSLDKLFGRLPGRLSYITILGGTLFATLSGSSLASTAMLGSVVVPETTRRGYKRYMAIGPILGSGGLAIIIPPSALAVLLGSIARMDIGALLIAGVVPGFALAALYALTVFVMVKIDPDAAPQYAIDAPPFVAKLRIVVVEILPLGLVLFCVIGLIILGIATPSESAAFGVLGVLVLMIAYRCFNWQAILRAINGALRVTVMTFMIIVGSSTFSQILAYSGATGGMIEWTMGYQLDRHVMLLLMFLVLLFLGMFVDAISMMLLTIPIFMPLLGQLAFDPIWFGVIMLLAMEIGGITPPFGLLLFVMMGVTRGESTLTEIVVASAPFLGCAVVMLLLLVAFPEIALYLPSLME